MTKKLLLIPLALLLAISLVAIGCPAEEEEPPPPPPPTDGEEPPPPPPEKTEILIGAINSMTGMEAMVGTEHRWAYQQAVYDINEAGGVYVEELGKSLPMRLMVVDDKSSIPDAAAAAEKLIKLENVDFLLGTVTSELNISGGSVAEKYKKLYVTTTHWVEHHQMQEWNWVATSFFSGAGVAVSACWCMDTMPEDERPEKLCYMAMDNPDGHAFGEGGFALAPAYGYEVMNEYYTVGQKDYSATILRFKGEGVDAMVWIGNSPDAVTLLRQMKENNYNLKYCHGMKGFWPIEFYAALGADADYLVSDAHWSEALGYGRSAELAERFRAEFGKTSVTIGNFYSLVEALAQAIEQAGSLDSAKVRDVFYSGTFVALNTTNGDLAFDETGLCPIPPVALQWMGGERMPVWPPAPDIWTLKWIPPWDER